VWFLSDQGSTEVEVKGEELFTSRKSRREAYARKTATGTPLTGENSRRRKLGKTGSAKDGQKRGPDILKKRVTASPIRKHAARFPNPSKGTPKKTGLSTPWKKAI